jgi:hypothetical protein
MAEATGPLMLPFAGLPCYRVGVREVNNREFQSEGR